jgi:vacuolar-type H+-ATPase subunit H
VKVEEHDELREVEEKKASEKDFPEEISGEETDSLEERIKEHEFELNIELLKVKKKAEQMVAEAEKKAEQIKAEAEKESVKEKEILHQKGLEKIKEEEKQIRLMAVEDVKSLEGKGRKRIDKAVEKIIDAITR